MKTIILEMPEDATALDCCSETEFPRQLRLAAAIFWYAERCRFRFAAEPPRAPRYWPTIPGVMRASSTPRPSHQARNRRTAD